MNDYVKKILIKQKVLNKRRMKFVGNQKFFIFFRLKQRTLGTTKVSSSFFF